MNEQELRDQVRRYLDGFGPYDRRHTAEGRESGPPRPVPASRPTPAPTPTPAIPTLLVSGSDHQGLVRMDWSGRVLGRIQLPAGATYRPWRRSGAPRRRPCGLPTTGSGRELAIAAVDPVRGMRRDYPAPAPFVNVWAASDGLFLVGARADDPITSSVVIDLTTGQQVARLAGAGFAFTADDRYVAVSSAAGERLVAGGTGSLVDWRTGRAVWQGPGQLAILALRPDADAVAVQLTTEDAHGISGQQELIVAPDAPAVPIHA